MTLAGQKKSNSYIVYEDSERVAIATGFSRKSKNGKTGEGTIAIWILNWNVDPRDAVLSGADSVVCGDCPLRGINGKQRGCYVRTEQAPKSIYKAYRKGSYSKLPSLDVFNGKFVRFGAYGEPVYLPFTLIAAIANRAKTFTGYTHQWKKSIYRAYRQYLMASCDASDYQQAIADGWRVFAVSKDKLEGLAVCPASAEAGHRTTCEDCGLCAGLSRNARSIQIAPHGNGKSYVGSFAKQLTVQGQQDRDILAA